MNPPNYRVTRCDDTGDFTQKDYRSFKAVQEQLLRWTRYMDLVGGEKLTFTVEVL